jgi:hypothetical protein
LGVQDFGGTVTAGVDGEFEAADFESGKDGFGRVVVDTEDEEVASAGEFIFLSFEDDFTCEAVAIAKDAEGSGGGVGACTEVFAEGYSGIPEVDGLVGDFGFKSRQTELGEMDTV